MGTPVEMFVRSVLMKSLTSGSLKNVVYAELGGVDLASSITGRRAVERFPRRSNT